MANRRSGKTGRRVRIANSRHITRHSTKPRHTANKPIDPVPIRRADLSPPPLTPLTCVKCMEPLPIYCDSCPRCNFPYRRPGPRPPGTNPPA